MGCDDKDVPRLKPCVELPLPDPVLERVSEQARDWALMHGVGMRSKVAFSKDALQFAPFTLTPSAFPRLEFEKAVAMQPLLNELTHRVAHDSSFLQEALAPTLPVDSFTRRLHDIWEQVTAEGVAQKVSLGMLRSDIMLETRCPRESQRCRHHQPYCCWKQVEINCIASGFGHLGPVSRELQRSHCRAHHHISPDDGPCNGIRNVGQRVSAGLLRSDYLLHSAAGGHIKQVEINTIASSFGGISTVIPPLQSYILQQLGHGEKIKNLPENGALAGLCAGMTEAWDLFGVPEAVILFVVEDVSYNICDQRFHEFHITQHRSDIRVVRRTLTELAEEARLDDKKQLILDGAPVAVVYFRAGYEPGHYPTEAEWGSRLLIERSNAIKCPSIHYHLAGTKKVQQTLARPGALERFLEPERARSVREIFTGLYSMDLDSFGDEAVKMAINDPERFVMKPQREGGGNNVYGADIVAELGRLGRSSERCAYILMERIRPPVVSGYVLRPGRQPLLADLVSELGIFGVILGSAGEVLLNRQVGHMLRTKLSDADEGGVAAGLGALDSPYLIDL